MIKNKLVHIRNYFIYKKYDWFSKVNQCKFLTNPKANFVVSIASYPKRSHLLPAVFEALNSQAVLPQKWILVLSEEDWPNFTLPNYLKKIKKKGVEIIWTKNNTYAVKKLIPVIIKYPDFGVITLDDDIIYNRNVLSYLIKSKEAKKGNIVGNVGKILLRKGNKLNMMFREKQHASIDTNPDQVFLIGWGGIYYPPKSLSNKVKDIDAINKIVPGRGSDIWFWAAAHAVDRIQCVVQPPKPNKLGIPIPTSKNTIPKDLPGKDMLEKRFQMTIDFFEIRQKLLSILPNKP